MTGMTKDVKEGPRETDGSGEEAEDDGEEEEAKESKERCVRRGKGTKE